MGEVIAIEHLTLDGVMQGPGNLDEDRRDGFEAGGWADRGQDPVMQQVMSAYMSSSWSLLAGRHTYAQFADFWPTQDGSPIAAALGRVHKYVASSTLSEPLPWQNSSLLRSDVPEAVSRLKAELEGNLVVFGSGVLVRSLLPHGLIDKLVLLTHPLVLGAGRRLFSDSARSNLELIDSATTGTGVFIGTYRPARS